MAESPKPNFIEPLTEDQKRQMFAQINATPSSLKADVKILREWYSQEPHFPKWNFTDNELIIYLLIEKGSIELAKSRIKMFFYQKHVLNRQCGSLHPLSPEMKKLRKISSLIILPKLNKDLTRVTIYRSKDSEELIGGYDFSALSFNFGMLRLQEDFCIFNEIIMDLSCVTLKKFMYTATTGFTDRRVLENNKRVPMKMIHLINPPSYVDLIIRTMRSFIKPKVAERIVVHDSLDSLKNYVEERILPKDYGGSERSIEELEEITERKFEEYKEFFDRLQEVKVDEELFLKEYENDEFLGYHGNFKKLDVD